MARSLRIALLAAAGAAGILAAPQAHAWVRFGVGVFPFAYAPYPYYAPPPVYYAPPPVIYAPPPSYAPAPPASSGPACYAGPYVCPLAQALPSGYSCSCPSNDGGRVSGRAG